MADWGLGTPFYFSFLTNNSLIGKLSMQMCSNHGELLNERLIQGASMTPTTKPVIRESSDRDAGRNIIIIVGPGPLLGFRLKGTRKVYTTTVLACYQGAVRAEVASKAAAKKKTRKARR